MGSGVFNNIKEQRQEQLFARVRRAGDPALPVANGSLGERTPPLCCVQRCCSWVKIRGSVKMMLQQAIPGDTDAGNEHRDSQTAG